MKRSPNPLCWSRHDRYRVPPRGGCRAYHRLSPGGPSRQRRLRRSLAAAPGGFPVALKFLAADTAASERELRSLQMLQRVRDGHLLSLFGVWRIPGFFLLAMELANGTLLDRLNVCRRQNLSGIAPTELLDWFQQAARGHRLPQRTAARPGRGWPCGGHPARRRQAAEPAAGGQPVQGRRLRPLASTGGHGVAEDQQHDGGLRSAGGVRRPFVGAIGSVFAGGELVPVARRTAAVRRTAGAGDGGPSVSFARPDNAAAAGAGGGGTGLEQATARALAVVPTVRGSPARIFTGGRLRAEGQDRGNLADDSQFGRADQFGAGAVPCAGAVRGCGCCWSCCWRAGRRSSGWADCRPATVTRTGKATPADFRRRRKSPDAKINPYRRRKRSSTRTTPLVKIGLMIARPGQGPRRNRCEGSRSPTRSA